MRIKFLSVDLDLTTDTDVEVLVSEYAPFACRVVPVDGGIMCFESQSDYNNWINQQ